MPQAKRRKSAGEGSYRVEITTTNPHTRSYADHTFYIDTASDESDALRQAKRSLSAGATIVKVSILFLGAMGVLSFLISLVTELEKLLGIVPLG